MATDGSRAQPIITKATSAPVNNALSFTPMPAVANPLSSSESFVSSRSPSRGSSRTSRSVTSSPSEVPGQDLKSVPSIELSNLSNPDPPPISSPPGSSPSDRRHPPRSEPERQAPPEATGNESWFTRSRVSVFGRNWLTNILGLSSLVITMVGLLLFGWRTYKIDIYNSFIGYRQNCQGQIQINGVLDPSCKASLALPPPKPPYALIGRALNSLKNWGLNMHAAINTASPTATGVHGAIDSTYRSKDSHQMIIIALITAFISVLGGSLLVKYLRCRPRTEEVFRSSARSDVQVTRYYPEGSETVTSGQDVKIVKSKPEEDHELGQLRQRIRKSQNNFDGAYKDISGSQSRNSSAGTLVSGWAQQEGRRPSNVTIQTSAGGDNKYHEGLIELETKGVNKTFFDPDTGEFIHLSPWKSTHNDSEDSEGEEDSYSKAKPKGKEGVKRVLAQMATGGVAWAGGKRIDDAILEDFREVGKESEGSKERIPQRAGDCLAGLVTNEAPSGRPTSI